MTLSLSICLYSANLLTSTSGWLGLALCRLMLAAGFPESSVSHEPQLNQRLKLVLQFSIMKSMLYYCVFC